MNRSDGASERPAPEPELDSGRESIPDSASESGVRSVRPLPGLFDDEEDGGVHDMPTRPGDSLSLASPAYDENKTVNAVPPTLIEPLVGSLSASEPAPKSEPKPEPKALSATTTASEAPAVTASSSLPLLASPRSRRTKIIAAVAVLGLSLGLVRTLLPSSSRDASKSGHVSKESIMTDDALGRAASSNNGAASASAAGTFEARSSSISGDDRKTTAPKATAIATAAPKAPQSPTSSRLDIAALGAESSAGRPDLGDALREAAGSRAAAAAKHDEATSNAKMVRPAAGAVRAAVGASLPAARACLDAAAEPITATLVFDGNGVPKVNVPPSPARDCIVAALGATRIEPFVEAPYSVPVIVRH